MPDEINSYTLAANILSLCAALTRAPQAPDAVTASRTARQAARAATGIARDGDHDVQLAAETLRHYAVAFGAMGTHEQETARAYLGTLTDWLLGHPTLRPWVLAHRDGARVS